MPKQWVKRVCIVMHHNFIKSRVALAIASALVTFAASATAAFHNESVTLDQDTTVNMLLGNKLSHNAAIGVDYTNPNNTYVIDTNGHKLTLTVGSSATPNNMHVGISALTSSANPGETKASDLSLKGNVQLDIISTSGSAFGVRNTGMSDITIDGNVTGVVKSKNSYVMGIDNQKYASITTINGDVDLQVSSEATTQGNMSYGLVAIGYPGAYNPNGGNVIDKERAQIHLNGNQVKIDVTGWASAGIQTAQSGEVYINADQSLIHVNGSAIAGIDICNATGAVNYSKGNHSIETNVIEDVGPGTPGANVGISNRGTLNVGKDVNSFTLSVVGIGGNPNLVMNPIGSDYSTIGIITDKFEGQVPTEGFDYASHTNLFAKNVNITVSDGESEAKDANIGGVLIQNGAFQTSTQTQLNVNVSSATTGSVHGLVAEGGSDVDVLGNASLRIVAENASETTALKADHGGNVLLAGANNEIVGDIVVTNQSEVSFEKGSTVVAGEINFDATSQMNMVSSSIELATGSLMTVSGSLFTKGGQIILNDATSGTLSIATLTEGSTLEAIASGNLNDKLGGDLNAFNNAISITNGAEGTTLVMQEGLVAGAKTAQLKEDGTVDTSTVTEKTNSVMQSSLEMASALPLTINRILTNDVRKRMGDLRASEGESGAWARYDGGKLSGDHGLDSDFHTIQVGVDTVPTPDSARFGVAFSYTDGDMDYVRNSSDMKAYSLAGYATWMGDNGMFVDTVVRMAKIDNDLTVDKALKGSMDSLAMSVSSEAGWRFDWNNLFYVEPQAEVMYTYIDGDNFELGNAQYTVDSMNSFTGRFGFASGIKCPNNKGDLYVRASVVHEFLGDRMIQGQAAGSTGMVEVDGKDTWIEYGFGGNFNLMKDTYFWGDVERTSGADLDTDWRATMGVRYVF